MTTLAISNLTKAYGDIVVLHGISVTINDGEFVSLIGSSGCGKSTLLRTIAGLESITSGSISMNDRIINTLPPKDRDIAMVFQNYALYPHLTVAENMGFSLKLRKVDKATARKAVEEAAHLLGLSDYLDRPPRALSGGQRQRVAMGRAIVRNPKVFLFDEPLSNLDAKLRVQMRLEIKTLQKRLGTTSVYVTHDQVEALTMSDRLVLLNRGNVEQIGTPSEVYHRPANTFVATFIGSPAMNLLKGTYVRDGETSALNVADTRIPLSGHPALQSGSDVTIGIRPEHLVPVAGAAAGCFRMAVGLSETTGAQTLVHGLAAGQEIAAMLSGDFNPPSGSALDVKPHGEAIHLFDHTSGARIPLHNEAAVRTAPTQIPA
ncbi:MAG: sn-glycerol-3-phosphate ABC transporter ATP-binding protein UgpC [Alphaproteobacteria bacterium]|nr:sn-glycerol-3-phosphate ABC transporter ATP-binding protein UgpC [Alphaproteobacteria bacterium]MBU1548536.1 sn-glycerol-3-phosphate ABC transporter ATP-binding protein UgpC [Alphaproteobacteria bacterium]MBU2337732.1 sn-glycerol-3-phosphate ABC transporter ATP-binding protein UgpC [Alphaproteobacteria bacterium]MBU2389869.1 sn-glycerol-3-phosphate ABC transporter ATP-binding protein UgpC [Alphaproteobacteria bacterium]